MFDFDWDCFNPLKLDGVKILLGQSDLDSEANQHLLTLARSDNTLTCPKPKTPAEPDSASLGGLLWPVNPAPAQRRHHPRAWPGNATHNSASLRISPPGPAEHCPHVATNGWAPPISFPFHLQLLPMLRFRLALPRVNAPRLRGCVGAENPWVSWPVGPRCITPITPRCTTLRAHPSYANRPFPPTTPCSLVPYTIHPRYPSSPCCCLGFKPRVHGTDAKKSTIVTEPRPRQKPCSCPI